MLTKKQRDLLAFILARQNRDGVCPSYEEMKNALKLHSKSGIHRLINGLEERGFIRRLANRARAIEIIKAPPVTATSSSDTHKVVRGSFDKSRVHEVQENTTASANVNIPLHGKIAAGIPIEALENVADYLSVPQSLLNKGEHFALEISGDSMTGMGILDGDHVIIRKTDTADNGDVVVALVDGQEATLKTLHKRGHQVALKPANPEFSAQILPAERIKIQGKLVALLRRY